jgi:PAS domain S-box-containing protein
VLPLPPDPAATFDLVPALVRDTAGQIQLWSTGAERLYGWARHDALGRVADTLLDTEPSAPRECIEAALQRDGVWQGTVRQRAADGRQLELAAYWAVQRDPAGATESVLEVATGPHAVSRATEAASRLAAIVESSEEAIIGKDLDGRVTSWNRAAEQMLGYTAEEMIGQPIALVLPPERQAEEAALLGRIARGLPVGRHESTRRRKDGSIVPIFLSISPVRAASGEIVGAATVARDISARLRGRQALRASQAELVHVSRLTELGQIASALAHEINQPLTAIANFASGARRLVATGNAAETETALTRIAEQADRGAQIVLRLRDFMRKRDIDKRPESLPTVIEEACALAMVGLRDRPVQLTRTLDPTAPIAVLDRVQIEQVLFNLLRNAIEAMAGAPRQEIAIVTRRLDSKTVQVEVADTGPGLPELVRARLFEPFVTTRPNGLGIGLSICRSIVAVRGGELTADDNPGGGTVFRFTLPVPNPTADGANL